MHVGDYLPCVSWGWEDPPTVVALFIGWDPLDSAHEKGEVSSGVSSGLNLFFLYPAHEVDMTSCFKLLICCPPPYRYGLFS